MTTPGRVAAVWVPDWPVLAATTAEDVAPHVPAAVHDGRHVTAVSAVARAQGVRRGMRRRRARETCPGLALLPADDARDVRLFEPVVVAVETVVPGVEVVRPGLLLLPSEGAGRYHGSEDALAERLVDAVGAVGYEAQVGVADGVGAAVLAARAERILPPRSGPAFLAPLGVGELRHVAAHDGADVTRLVDLLTRLGVRTLGDLARLPRTDVTARFGPVGTWAHQVASGQDDRPTALRRPEEDVAVEQALDPPVDRIEGTAFAARGLAEALHARLVERGAGCGRLQIVARTEGGDELVRTWRTDAALGGLAVARITDRVRWQLEGWLTRSTAGGRRLATHLGEDPGPSALVHLALRAEEVVAVGAEQGRLWGDPSGGDRRAHRALHRVQGLLGADSVLGVAVQGGRDLRDQVHVVPWGEDVAPPRPADAPWPGRLPPPAPATVLQEPERAELLGADGRPVQVSARLELSAEPVALRRASTTHAVSAWAGPWPVVQRWWGPDPQRAVYLQAVTDDDGPAVLLALRAGAWAVEARYD
ncbi:DNA polymerase Y family protein [Actinotalea sp. AC32]|nr:DNA polymerase Y family protein [Actinotalea sp. AC32]